MPRPVAHPGTSGTKKPRRRDGDGWQLWEKRVRDIGVYILALAGAYNELFLVPKPRETVLVFLAAMLGFPLVLRADERRRNGSNGQK